MKKPFLLLMGVFVTLFSSCKKKYNCSCTYNYGSYTGNLSFSSQIEAAKSKADDECMDSFNDFYLAQGYTQAEINAYISYYGISCSGTAVK